jgi:predicted RNA-binding Zn-ribbon protein involved in translation (DUF1610 family)
MQFRLWFYIIKVAGFLFPIAFLTLVVPVGSVLGHLRYFAICLIIIIGVVVVLMGIRIAFGKLRMLCPFCGKSGRVGATKRQGLWMECDNCGFVHGRGPLRLKIVREILNDEDAV